MSYFGMGSEHMSSTYDTLEVMDTPQTPEDPFSSLLDEDYTEQNAEAPAE